MATDLDQIPTPDMAGLASGWWKNYVDVIPSGYLDFLVAEEDATRIVHFHPIFVPGLLQTERYATAITGSTSMKDLPTHETAALVRVRMLRQQWALDPTRAKHLVFLLDESCLRRPVGSTETMREQLAHLLGMTDHPKVTMVVVPFRSEPHPGLLGAFNLLEYGDGIEDVLCFEWQLGNTIIRGQPDLVRRYRQLANLLADTHPSDESAKPLIEAALSAL
jgi:Domain of unknown function (DUF5753)